MSAADEVKRAWTDKGTHPEHHRISQFRLYKQWPVLFNAIEKLVRETPSSVGITEEDTRQHQIADLLLEHGRDGIRGCRCGWAELGKSHADHVAKKIMEVL